MALNDQSKIGLANRFRVTVQPEGYNLGSWAKADGLDVSWEVPDYRMGDGWNSRLLAPANTKYNPVKLTRAADSKDSVTVRQWLEKTASKNWDVNSEITVVLHDSFGTPVIDWVFRNVVVKKWSITTMDAGSSTVAIEQLEFEHEGFLEDLNKL